MAIVAQEVMTQRESRRASNLEVLPVGAMSLTFRPIIRRAQQSAYVQLQSIFTMSNFSDVQAWFMQLVLLIILFCPQAEDLVGYLRATLCCAPL